MPTVFVDSNVVIYSRDPRTPSKMNLAGNWLRSLGGLNSLVISRQVIHDSYVNLISKKGLAVAPAIGRAIVRPLELFATAQTDVATLNAAWTIEDRFGVRFFDALLLASARGAGCRYFLSEDLNDGQDYGGVTVLNPFRHAPEDVLGPAA